MKRSIARMFLRCAAGGTDSLQRSRRDAVPVNAFPKSIVAIVGVERRTSRHAGAGAEL
ncbi:MAG: hypothetical protein QM581_13610 [Pseudomonas sp.]